MSSPAVTPADVERLIEALSAGVWLTAAELSLAIYGADSEVHPMKTVTLINGPYNGRQIEDSGADPIRMGIYDNTNPPFVSIGTAIYRRFPMLSPDGEQAFWDGNEWAGQLDETIPA